METFAPASALSASEREELGRLLDGLPPGRRWAVEHRNEPLLCTLGLVKAPDAGYADAARRRFGDHAELRRRALALIDELAGEIRMDRHRDGRGRFTSGFPGFARH